MRKFKVGALFLSSFYDTCSNDQMLRTRANELAQNLLLQMDILTILETFQKL